MKWYENAVMYHIYPLGFCGAPKHNEGGEPVNRLEKVLDWIPHLKELGVDAVYFGPVFESVEHGYDTTDYGSYYTVEVRNRQLLFAKEQDGRTVYVALNLEDCPSEFRFGTHVPSLVDVVSGQPVQVENGGAWIRVAPFSAMILVEDDIVNNTEPETEAVAVPEPTVLEAGAKYRDVLDGTVCELLQPSARHAETQEELVVYRRGTGRQRLGNAEVDLHRHSTRQPAEIHKALRNGNTMEHNTLQGVIFDLDGTLLTPPGCGGR